MTDRPTNHPSEPDRRPDERIADSFLIRALSRARWALLWERLWPALASLATAAGLFVALSWAGLWLLLPPIGRAVALFVVAVITAICAIPLIRFRIPSVDESLRRLDRGSGAPHRPATALADTLANGTDDQVSLALWRVHVQRTLRRAHLLRAGLPAPRLADRDPMALRALVLLLVVATFFAAAGERGKRIAAAFDWTGVVPLSNFRVDAWVTPPAYTGKPPVILPGLRTGELVPAATPQAVPAGSVLVVRASGTHLDVATTGGLEAAADAGAHPPAGTQEYRYIIRDGGSATLRGATDEDVTYTFSAVPDRPPTIALTKDPEPQSRGSLALSYRVEDDYGVVSAEAGFARKGGGSDAAAHPLYGPPDFPLSLPQARTRNGVGQTTRDLSDHPWAGTEVMLTLKARDEAGNEGTSPPFEMRLPERPFAKPLARALVEQRRLLAMDAGAKPHVLNTLDALAIAPERFTPEASVYLGLRTIYWQLEHAKSDDELRDVAGRLWSMAVAIEDGNVSEAEQALRSAEDALRQALERGANEEEIKRLTDELRAALDKFVQALTEQMRKNPQALSRPLDPNSRVLRSQDLKNLLDRIENLARSGAKDAARQLLQELQSMLENLQMARPGAQDGDDDDEMTSALDQLGDMIRQQQQLRDRTFRQGQEMHRDEQRGQPGQHGARKPGQPGELGDLKQNQQTLREQLQKMIEELRKHGQLPQPGQQGQGQGQQGQQGQGQGQGEGDSLGSARDAMGEAEGALGEGNADNAVESQGRALDALRKGAQGLAQQMQQGPGSGPGQARTGQARAQQDTDPLGRPIRHGPDYGDDGPKVPDEIDVQRARHILEELRRRFSEPARPQIELDYIERMLRDF